MPDDDFYEDHEQLELEIDELIEEQALLEKWKDDIDRAHPNAGSDSGPTQKRTIAFREQSQAADKEDAKVDRMKDKLKYMKQSDRPNQDKQLYVHLVAHTHDDVGWLKSPEELFVGAR